MKFLAEDDGLTITLEGVEVIWSLKRKLVVPRSQIVELSWEAEYVLPDRLFRLAGSDIPSVSWAGRFVGNHQKSFMYVERPKGMTWTRNSLPMTNVLVLRLQGHAYDEVIVSCQPDIGAQLLNWWQTT